MKSNHFFFLGTGRCGTLTVAEMFSKIEGCKVPHEAEPWLVERGVAYRSGKMSRPEILEVLRTTRSPEALGGERFSGESNLMLSFLLPEVSEAFPEAKYIWLIRDGRDMVLSAMERGWFNRLKVTVKPPFHPWIDPARADEAGEMSTSEWENLGDFGRAVWYWSYTNRLIEKDSKRLNLNILYVKLEDMKKRIGEMMQFVGIDSPPEISAPHTHASNVRIRQRMSWRYWSPRQREIFSRLAGETMDQHYPGWREPMRFTTGQEVSAMLNRSWISLYDTCTRPVRPYWYALTGRQKSNN